MKKKETLKAIGFSCCIGAGIAIFNAAAGVVAVPIAYKLAKVITKGLRPSKPKKEKCSPSNKAQKKL
jgi:hypothetical protein